MLSTIIISNVAMKGETERVYSVRLQLIVMILEKRRLTWLLISGKALVL